MRINVHCMHVGEENTVRTICVPGCTEHNELIVEHHGFDREDLI